MGARRRALFAGHGAADREPDRLADGRPHLGAAGRHAALSAGAGGARPQGRVPQGARRVHEEGLPARQSRRRFLRDRRSAGAGQEIHPRHRRRGRSPGGAARHRHAAGGLARAGAQARRRAGGRGTRGCSRPAAGAKANKQRNETAERLVFSEKFACPVSGFTIPEIEPRLFSFNNPFGACPKCGGLGVEQHIDADLVIPDKERTLRKGAIAPWAKSSSPYYVQTLGRARQALQIHARHQMEGSAEEDPGSDPLRLRRHRDPLLLRRRHARLRDQAAVRRRDHQSRAPLQGDRQRLGARGDRPLFHRRALRGLPRLSAQARSAVRQDRREAHRRSLRSFGEGRRALVRRAAGQAQRQAERDRRRASSRKSARG